MRHLHILYTHHYDYVYRLVECLYDKIISSVSERLLHANTKYMTTWLAVVREMTCIFLAAPHLMKKNRDLATNVFVFVFFFFKNSARSARQNDTRLTCNLIYYHFGSTSTRLTFSIVFSFFGSRRWIDYLLPISRIFYHFVHELRFGIHVGSTPIYEWMAFLVITRNVTGLCTHGKKSISFACFRAFYYINETIKKLSENY